MRIHSLAAAGLLLLFAACEKELPASGEEGKKVPVLFSIEPTGYNSEDEKARSGGVGEPVTSTIPLDNEFCLEATLVPDADGELRGPAAFKEGQKLCFAAFLTGGTQVGTTAVYTYSGGKWTSSAPLGVTPDNVTEYRFVAYSYFDETGTPPTDGAGIDPVHDLVWGMSVNTKIEDETEAARTVTIHMTHKFARVKVRIKSSISSATITYLSGIAIDGGQTAALNLFTGNITWSGSVTQDMGLSGNYSAGEVASEYRTVKPVASPTRVLIGSVRVSANNSTFSNKTVEISTPLNGAASYNLLVEVKSMGRWARSNIYWNGSALTFDKVPMNPSHENYQGVFFQWGSLIGISPAGAAASAAVYVPNVATYPDHAGSAANAWDGTKNVGNLGGWGAIPHLAVKGGNGDGDRYLYDNQDFGNYTGDVCQYIDADWRMPLKGEMNGTAPVFTVGSDPGNATGRGSMGNAGVTWGGFFLPASGWRWYSDGALSDVGDIGFHWSGSRCTTSQINAYANAIGFPRRSDLLPSESTISVYGNGAYFTRALPIRCILKLPGE